MRRKLILDVDTGTDDAVAIMLAALHPDLDLIACTTVNGNVDVQQATDNTLRVLEFIGRADVPVYEGLHRPIARKDFPVPRSARDMTSYIHGFELPLPPPTIAKQRGHAVEFLIETYRTAREEIALVPLGPSSNVAVALALAPDFVDLVPEVVMMGGAHAIGNTTPSTGFNTWSDPEAAASVLDAGFRQLTMIPIDATHQALITRDDCRELAALGTPAGIAASKLIERRIAGHIAGQPMSVLESTPVHDPLCVAFLTNPSIVTTRFLHVAVETKGELTLGRTVIDVSSRSGKAPNCHVAFHADGAAFTAMLKQVFGTARPPRN
ncbi:nucleoside hydrolase [Variovorax sp. PBL-E5]|uniref:nucleoside hydrolase n=1 Tax=Variovorax sp. PBL-E5 TaxID=434014 RepID=UPI0013192F8E|nr:nucleoside hydrolase [Variovorax sp. PBL-E5]VTU30225.1 Pyrimidine-specific ribonucleoside hydrolase RihB [Variovorax sp. PBL-E5]